MGGLKKPRTPCPGLYSVWYKLIHFSPLLNPSIQRMCNTLNILCSRCREQDKSHPHFIFYFKLSIVTPDYISELINLNCSFNISFKFSLKTIIMSSFWVLSWCTFKNSTKILEVILMHLFKVCHEDGYDEINELSNFECYLVSCFNKLRDTADDLGSKKTFLRT